MQLKTRAIKSTVWFAGSRVCIRGVMWVVSILLARLLTPADYGLFAMSLAVIAFIELFQEFGFGVAIVQRQELRRQQINAVFWIILGASVVVAAASFVGAPLAARFYDEPRLVWLVRALGLTFLLNSLGMVPFNLLTREIDFKSRSLAEASGALASAAAALSLGYAGFGVWALIWGHLARAFVRNLWLLLACGWKPGPDVSFDGMRDILKLGLNVAGANIVGTVSGVIRTFIIGRFLGSSALGMYGMAGSLGQRNPIHKVSTSVINQLSLPVFSRLQRDDQQLRRYFLKISKYLAVISLPLQIGMALVAHDMVEVVLTAKWLPMVPLLQVFCVGGVLSVLPLPSSPLLTARGRADLVLRVTTVSGVLLVTAYLVGAQFGLVGLITAWALVFPSVRFWLLCLSLREIGLTLGQYLANISSSLLAAAAMAVAVLFVGHAPLGQAGALERLVIGVSVGAVTYISIILLSDRRLGAEVKGIVHELRAPSRA